MSLLFIRNATLPDGRTGIDLLARDGRIAALGPALPVPEGAELIDAQGWLLSPPFVDAHFHMDATLSYGLPRVNASGTLLEGIALWGELKPQLTLEALVERALQYCDWAVAKGLLAIRSHVDVCDDRLLAVQALLQVREQVKPYLDLQLVAFPQDGLLRSPNALANLRRALDLGVDVVGGIPHFERTMNDGAESVRLLCELAAERGLRVDMHCDESDDPLSRHIETLAFHTQRLGLQGRVTGSHLTSMHSMDNYYVSKLLPLIAEAGVHAVANPLINITLQGRHDSYPRRRGMTRVPELSGRRRERGLRPRLRDGPVVLARLGRHAGSGGHGPARGADDLAGADAPVLRCGDGERRARARPARLRAGSGLPRRLRAAAGALAGGGAAPARHPLVRGAARPRAGAHAGVHVPPSHCPADRPTSTGPWRVVERPAGFRALG